MRIRKELMGVFLIINVLGFASVSKAQDSSETKKACDFIAAGEVSSILGATVQASLIPGGDGCMYMGDQAASAMIIFSERNSSSEVLKASYQNCLNDGGKPVQGLDGTAAEKADQRGIAVYFFKNGMMGTVGGNAVQDQPSKVEAIAKLLISKL